MTADTLDTTAIFSSIDDAAARLQHLMASLDDSKINTIPYKDSWTAGMLYRHITKVTGGIAQAMQMPPRPAGRSTDEKVPELKSKFLDFSTKMKAPDMAVPEEGDYKKQDVLNGLNGSFAQLKEVANKQNPGDLVTGLPLGDLTKQELLHFILYHTQRHLHQMQKIVDALA